jgi:hypothetical protein
MKIVISSEAVLVIKELAKFVEIKNTPGSGKRFASKFLKLIKSKLLKFDQYGLCKYPEFQDKKWRCLIFKDWIVVYAKNQYQIEIKLIVHGSLLNY